MNATLEEFALKSNLTSSYTLCNMHRQTVSACYLALQNLEVKLAQKHGFRAHFKPT